MRLRVWLIMLLLLQASFVWSATYTSIRSGNWEDASTWDKGSVPGSGDAIVIKHQVTLSSVLAASTKNITITGSAGFLVLEPGAGLSYNTINVGNGWLGSMSIAEGVTVNASAVTVSGDPSLTTLYLNGTLNVSGNLLVNRGNFHMGSNANLSVGGKATFDQGTYTLSNAVTISGNLQRDSGTMTVSAGTNLTIGGDLINKNGGDDAHFYIYGNVEVAGSLNNSYPLEVMTGGYLHINSDVSNNGGGTNHLIIEGLMEIEGDFANSGDAEIEIINQGELIIHGDVRNLGSANFNIDGGSLVIDGTFDNGGGAEFVVDGGGDVQFNSDVDNSGGANFFIPDGSVTIDGNLSNTGGADIGVGESSDMVITGDFFNSSTVVIDGSVSVDGTVTQKKWNGSMTGDGFLDAGTIIDETNLISENLLFEKMYAIGSGEWSTIGLWSLTPNGPSCGCLPDSRDRAYIDGEYAITISSDINAHSFDLSQNSFVEITNNATATFSKQNYIKGTLTINSGTSYIDLGGTRYGPDANVYTKLSVAANKFTYLSSPITDLAASSLPVSKSNFLFTYDETQADHWGEPNDDDGSNDEIGWQAVSGNLAVGKGYAYFNLSGASFTFKGSLNSGTLSASITSTTHSSLPNNTLYDGWNFVGNPYPSGLDAIALIGGNSQFDGNIYLWDDDLSQGADYSSADYIQVNSAGMISGGNGSGFNGVLAPFQGFFVKANVASGQINFTNTMRTGGANVLLKKSNTVSAPGDLKSLRLDLKLSGSSLHNETLIAFTDEASLGVDHALDGIKRKGNANIAFYSKIDGAEFGIQSVPLSSSSVHIPLGFDVAVAGNYTITISQIDISANKLCLLEDTWLDKLSVLSANSPYSFNTEVGKFADRFVLHVRDADSNNTTVYLQDKLVFSASREGIRVISLETEPVECTLKVYNTWGQLLSSEKLQITQEVQLPFNSKAQPGFFVIVAAELSNGETISRKLFLPR